MNTEPPAAADMDAWLAGYGAALEREQYIYPEREAIDALYTVAGDWIREQARIVPVLYRLRELEIQWGRDRTPEGKRDSLHNLLLTCDAMKEAA